MRDDGSHLSSDDDLHGFAEQLDQDGSIDAMGGDVPEADEEGETATPLSPPTKYPESVHEGRPLVDLSQEE